MVKSYILHVYSEKRDYKERPLVLGHIDNMMFLLRFLNIKYNREGWIFNLNGSVEKFYKSNVATKLDKKEIQEIGRRLSERGFELEVFKKLEDIV
jgi:hypothetical protein